MTTNDIKFAELPGNTQKQIKQLLLNNDFRAAKALYHLEQDRIYRRIKK